MRRQSCAFWSMAIILVGAFSGRVLGQDIDAKQDATIGLSNSTNPLSLADLEQLALANNPTLRQAAAQADALRGKALQAGLWPNPRVGYIAEQIGVEGTIGEFQGGFVQQTIITAGKRRLSRAKYNVQTQAMEFRAMQQQLKVLNGIRMHFYDLLAAHNRLRLHQDLLANATEHYRTALEQFNTGQLDQAQLLLVKNELNIASVDYRKQQNRYLYLARELAAVVGVPDLKINALAGDLAPQGAPLDWDTSLARILSESPEMMIAQAHVDYARLTIQRERVAPIPNIDVTGSVGYNAESKETVAGVQVGFRLPIWNKNQGNILQAQAELARDLANVNRVELSLQQRLAHHFKMYRNAYITSRIYQTDNIPNAKKAHEIYLKMYKERRIAWPEVVRLRRNLIMVELAYVDSLRELRRAEVAITGLLTVDGLTAPPGPTPGGHMTVSPQPR